MPKTNHQKYTESLPAKKKDTSMSLLKIVRPKRQQQLDSLNHSLSSSVFERNSFQLFASKLTQGYKLEAHLLGLIN